MHGYARVVAQLRSMTFLLEEALRIADEGGHALIGAKICDSITTIEHQLAAWTRDTDPSAKPACPAHVDKLISGDAE